MVIALSVFLCLSFLLAFRGQPEDKGLANLTPYKGDVTSDPTILHGEAKAAKLENATLKSASSLPRRLSSLTNIFLSRAELGHAAWKVLHTMMAKFPDEPTEDDSVALKSYIHLFARLYPCGDCARHFQKILEKFPPQVKSRSTAAAWACHVHNEVNKRLKKELFDCSKIGDFYDCGCAEEKKPGDVSGKGGKGKVDFRALKLEKEG
jgi:FAD-linked sulfhydryl oxidase